MRTCRREPAHQACCVLLPPLCRSAAGTAFNLSDDATVQQLLQGALDELTAAATDGAPPAVDSAAVLQAAAGTITLLNGFLQQVQYACSACSTLLLPASHTSG